MCMDVFAPGCCINIEFYFEQIWLSPHDSVANNIKATEVYDLCISNPNGNPAVSEFWLLFPHDYTCDDGQGRYSTIRVWPLTPAVWNDQKKYGWPYLGEPKRSDAENLVTLEFFSEPPTLSSQMHTKLSGKPLSCGENGVGFPDGFAPEHVELLARGDILKTLVCVKLSEPLRAGDKGWVRIIAYPQNIDAAEPKPRFFPGVDCPFQFEHRLAIICPLIVRDNLLLSLDGLKKFDADSALPMRAEHVRAVVCSRGIYKAGTSTRIADHRLALIIDSKIELCETTCTKCMKFIGRVPPLEREGHTAILWAGGSDHNREGDIVHNAKRVIDMIRYNGPRTLQDLALALAPSGKHEAFCVLLDKMREAGILLATPGNPTVAVPQSLLDCQDIPNCEYVTKLRKLYAPPSPEKNYELLANFRDLHPFQIDLKLKWFVSDGEFGKWVSPLLNNLNSQYAKRHPKENMPGESGKGRRNDKLDRSGTEQGVQ